MQVLAFRQVFHSFEFSFQSQSVKAAQELELASVLNRVGDSAEDFGELVNRGVLRPIVRGLKLARGVSVTQRLFAGAGDDMLGVVKVAVEELRLLGERENLPAVGLRHRELGYIVLIARAVCVPRLLGIAGEIPGRPPGSPANR